MRVEPLEPRRVRYPKGAYGWAEQKIVTDGHIQALGCTPALVYLFLCTVGNREGISFWGRPRMARTLNLSGDAIDEALEALVAADLIAATDRIVQVLPVPTRSAGQPVVPPTTPMAPAMTTTLTCPPVEPHREPSEDEIRAREGEARVSLARFCGRREPSAGAVRALAKSLALMGPSNMAPTHEGAADRSRP